MESKPRLTISSTNGPSSTADSGVLPTPSPILTFKIISHHFRLGLTLSPTGRCIDPVDQRTDNHRTSGPIQSARGCWLCQLIGRSAIKTLTIHITVFACTDTSSSTRPSKWWRKLQTHRQAWTGSEVSLGPRDFAPGITPTSSQDHQVQPSRMIHRQFSSVTPSNRWLFNRRTKKIM